MKCIAYIILSFSLAALGQNVTETGQITGVVKDPAQAVVSSSQITLTNQQTKAKITAMSDGQGVYKFPSVPPGAYVVGADVKGFRAIASPELKLIAGQTVNFDFALTLAGATDTLNVTAANVENAYRVDKVEAGGPLGTTPLLDLPYSVNVISRQLIDDTQSRNFKEAAKYLPLVMFQEMQGPEVPASRDSWHAGQQHAERPQGRNGNRGHHAIGSRRIRAARSR
jgi:Outer membrane receptor for monomeric catechols